MSRQKKKKTKLEVTTKITLSENVEVYSVSTEIALRDLRIFLLEVVFQWKYENKLSV